MFKYPTYHLNTEVKKKIKKIEAPNLSTLVHGFMNLF